MPINPETLKALRTRKRLSQQGLAELSAQIRGGSVSKRTIARIESGGIAPDKVRAHTVESLAKALDVKPEALCKPLTEDDDAEPTLQAAGYRRVSVWLREDTRLNYRWVMHHYAVSPMDLIEAAPWMFTLLAEMSLAERRRRLDDFIESFEDAMTKLPGHLSHGAAALIDFETACGDEWDSLASRDIFGRKVLETDSMLNPFDPDVTNPFIDFLRRTAEALDFDAIDPEHLTLRYGGGMPDWPVFEHWLYELTGGDRWARFAVEKVKGVVDAMPDDLKAEERTAERIQWLIDRIPAEMRAREEERLAKEKAKLERLAGACRLDKPGVEAEGER